MVKGYQDPKEEITNPILSITSKSEMKQLREINKGKVGLPPIPNILQLYPLPESESKCEPKSNIITVNTTDVTTENHNITLPNNNNNTHNILLDYKCLFKEINTISHTVVSSDHDGYQIKTTATLHQINRLELLVDFSFKHSSCKNPQALIKCLRERGYKEL